MKQFDFTVQSPVGIHARPAMLLAQKAGSYVSKIVVEKNGKKVNAKNLVYLLNLHANQNETVTFYIEGEDEEIAAQELQEFCEHNL